MARLTLDQIEQSIQLRVDGDSYTKIAAKMGVGNTAIFRQQIAQALQDRTNNMAANVLVTAALDLARLESMVPKNLELAKEGSDRNVKAVISIIKTKMDVLDWMHEIMERQEDDSGGQSTISTQDPEYLMALEQLNADVIDGSFENTDPAATVSMDNLTEQEIQLLRDQMTDLEMNLQIEGVNDEED
jgi:transposase-like protein